MGAGAARRMSVLSVHAKTTRGAFALDAQFDAPLNAVTAMFGPSGAGKSLLLSVIAGLERQSGSVVLNGRTLDGPELRVPAHERGIGLVFQDARLFPHLSVRGNLHYAAKRAPKALLSIEDAAALFDIASLLDRPIRNLSGGERSRVALARALLSAPDLLLLDEPFAALDGARRAAFLDVLDELHQRYALPMLVVTHQIDDVARIASRVVAIEQGRVVLNAPLLEAGGSTAFQNLLAARDTGVAVPLSRIHGGGKGAAWVRADSVLLASKAPEGLSARNVWAGRVDQVVEESNARVVRVQTEFGPVLSRITAEAAHDLQIGIGANAWAIVKTHAL